MAEQSVETAPVGGVAVAAPGGRLYPSVLVAILSLNFGILFFDRNALSFLMPFVQPDLGLSNTQVGLTSSALSLSWALAALAIGAAADRSGKRKPFLILCTVAFSVCSFLTGIARTFAVLIGARLLMGSVEGGVAPISQSMIAAVVPPERRGLAMGLMQNFWSNILGSFVAPITLVWIATQWSWQDAFFIAGIPGLICALLIWLFVKEPPAPAAPAARPENFFAHVKNIAVERNIALCVFMSILLVSYLVVCWSFMPLFLIKIRGFDPSTMSWLMATLGIAATIGSFTVTSLSDAIGRKPVMIVTSFLGILLPLGAMYFTGSVWVLVLLFAFGWSLTGIFPIFMATVPSESVDARHITTAMALVMGMGEVVGGVFAPTAAGWAADASTLAAPLWIMVGLCVVAGVLALGIRETAPAILRKRKG